MPKVLKKAAEVEKKVTTFGENIRPGQCQPYVRWWLVCIYIVYIDIVYIDIHICKSCACLHIYV